MIHERTWDRGAGQGEIKASAAASADGGRPFLDGVAERQRGHEREQGAHQPEHGARHDGHVQARDREDMGEAGIAHRLVYLLGDAAALAGDESRRDLSRLSRQRRSDAGIDDGSQRIDPGPGREIPWRGPRLAEGRDLAGGVAGGADPGEPGLAPEVEAARLDRLGRRLKRGMERDRRADPRAGAVARGRLTRTR